MAQGQYYHIPIGGTGSVEGDENCIRKKRKLLAADLKTGRERKR